MRLLTGILLSCLLFSSCEKHDENGRFRADFVGIYHANVQVSKAWGDPSAPDSTTFLNGLDTLNVYFGEAFDELIVLDHPILINSKGEFEGDHPLANPASFEIAFTEADSVFITYQSDVTGGRETWNYKGKKR